MKKLTPIFVLIALAFAAQTTFASGGGVPGKPAPDAGSTALMLSAVLGGMSWVSKRLRR